MKRIIYPNLIGTLRSTKEIEVDIPSQCPNCGIAFGDLPIYSLYVPDNDSESDEGDRIFSSFFCPHCGNCFLVQYEVYHSSLRDASRARMDHLVPAPVHVSDFPDMIKNLSPKFVEIYNQSERAESLGLCEICGVGYRKSLEYLVKDYAIYKFPNSETNIKNMNLASCIKNYIEADNIQTLAERSAWIGNDETHYVRKHENRDFNDMKKFIQGIVYFIGMTLVTDDAASIRPKK